MVWVRVLLWRVKVCVTMGRGLDRTVLFGIGLVVTVLVVSAAVTYRNITRLDEDAGWVAHTHEVLDLTGDVLLTLVDAETGERGFVITGREEFLQPYNAALAQLDQRLSALKQTTIDNPRQQERIQQLDAMAGVELALLREGIDLRRKSAAAAQTFVIARKGKEQMDAIRGLVAQMEQQEQHLLEDRQRQSASTYRTALVTGVVTAAAGLVMVGAFVWLLNRSLSARHKAAAVIHEQRELFRTTLASIGDAVITTDTRGRVTFLNPVAQTLTGWKQEEAMDRPLLSVFNIVDEQTRQPAEDPASRALEKGAVIGLANHTLLIARDGSERPIDDSAAPIRSESGELTGVVLVFRDVTERRQAERTNREIVATLESLTDGFWKLDRDWRFTFVSGEAARSVGQTPADLVGRALWEAFAAVVGTDVETQYRRAVSEGVTVEFENYYEPARRWFAVRAFPTPDGGLAVLSRDITDRKQAAEAVRQSEERFRQLADAMPQIVWSARPDGNIDYLNRRWTEFTGSPQTAGNDAWGQLLHPDDAGPANERWLASLACGAPFDMEIRLLDRRSQSYRWHLVRTVAIHEDSGKVTRWFGTATDIDEQKRAEESSRFLAEASATLAAVVDYESTLRKVAGLAVPRFADWCAVDMVETDSALRRLAVVHVDPAKVKLAYDFQRRYPPDPASPHGALQVLRTGESDMMAEIPEALLVQGARDEEHRDLLRKLGLKSYMCVPIKGRGKLLGVITFVSAESGRRYTRADLAFAEELARRAAVAIENARLYTELREADRVKDEFLAMLAHELRNPLAPVRNALYVLKQPGADGTIMQQARDTAERQVQHMARLLDDLLDVSRISRGRIELRKEAIDVSAVIARAVEGVRPLIDERRHELTVSVAPDAGQVEADPTRLEQIFANLLNNGAKYTDPGGHIRVTAEREGREVVVRVKDDGIGISREMLSRVFDLFVQAERRLDRSQGGVGIGLTLVRRLVELHGGKVEAHSQGLGQGSEFVVRLPALDPKGVSQPRDAEAQGASTTQARSRRVLVVDDNEDAAESLAMLLRLEGQEVRVAFNGPAALQVAREFRPQVAFLDIGMPGMDGYELARRMRSLPLLKGVVLVAQTGWGQEDDRRRSQQAGFHEHLVKPTDPAALRSLLVSLDTLKE
jgi:PAS domain S-box-containing protein